MCSTLVSSLLFFQTHHAWSAHNLLPDYLNHPNAGHFKLILKNNNWITPLPDDPSLLLFHAAQAYNAAETDMAEQRTVEAAANVSCASLSAILTVMPRVWQACALLYKQSLFKQKPLSVEKLHSLGETTDQVCERTFFVSCSADQPLILSTFSSSPRGLPRLWPSSPPSLPLTAACSVWILRIL